MASVAADALTVAASSFNFFEYAVGDDHVRPFDFGKDVRRFVEQHVYSFSRCECVPLAAKDILDALL